MRTLKEVIKEYIYKSNEKTLHSFMRTYAFMNFALREFNQGSSLSKKTTELELSDIKTIDLDKIPDYNRWLKIGVQVGDRIDVFTPDSSIAYRVQPTARVQEIGYTFTDGSVGIINTSMVAGQEYEFQLYSYVGDIDFTVEYGSDEVFDGTVSAGSPRTISYTPATSSENITITSVASNPTSHGYVQVNLKNVTEYETKLSATVQEGSDTYVNSSRISKNVEYKIDLIPDSGSATVYMEYNGEVVFSTATSASDPISLYHTFTEGSGDIYLRTETNGTGNNVLILFKETAQTAFNPYYQEVIQNTYNSLLPKDTLPPRHNQVGYFNVDEENNVIQFSSEVDSETIYLEYVANNDGYFPLSHPIHDDQIAVLTSYARLEDSKFTNGSAAKETIYREQEYLEAKRMYSKRRMNISPDSILEAVSRHQTLTIR